MAGLSDEPASTPPPASAPGVAAKPVVTDSIVANTRRVNGIVTPDAKCLVFIRESAADR